MSKERKKLKKSILRTYSMGEIKQQAKTTKGRMNEIDKKLSKEITSSWRCCLINPPPPEVNEYYQESEKLAVLEEIIERYDDETKTQTQT
jgi:hypothetical protein